MFSNLHILRTHYYYGLPLILFSKYTKLNNSTTIHWNFDLDTYIYNFSKSYDDLQFIGKKE